MSPDIREVLRRAAGPTSSSSDFATIWERARTLRIRRRLLSLVGAAALVSVAAMAIQYIPSASVIPEKDGHSQVAATPSESPSPSPSERSPSPSGDGRFHPDARKEGSYSIMPVIFPDGTAAELAFPRELDLTSLGVNPNREGQLDMGGCGSSRELSVRYGDEDFFTSNSTPITEYQGAGGGRVVLWETRSPPARFYLVFRFEKWRVGIYDGDNCTMSEQERRAWAENLQGRTTPAGFLVLEATPRYISSHPVEQGILNLSLGLPSAKA